MHDRGMTKHHLKTSSLHKLLADLLELRHAIVSGAKHRIANQQLATHTAISSSVSNLAHYLALREYDLRDLQTRLTLAGLSSLAHGESHVMANLDRVIVILSAALGNNLPQDFVSHVEHHNQDGLLRIKQRANQLFGEASAPRQTRIMVTLPTEAAYDETLVSRILAEGVECVRINCAHDDAATWQAMIDNVKQAASVRGKACKILMDLAGQKVRTGRLHTQAAVKHLRPHLDAKTKFHLPLDVYLTATPTPLKLSQKNMLPICRELDQVLQPGDVLRFADIRGKQRRIEIISVLPNGDWYARCSRNAYIASRTQVHLDRNDITERLNKIGDYYLGEFDGEPEKITLYKGQQLLLTFSQDPGNSAHIHPDGVIISPAYIGCSHPEVLRQVKVGQSVWFDDGKMGTVVDDITREGLLLRVTDVAPRGFRLRAEKGLNFPDTPLQLEALTGKDLRDLDFIVEHADMVGYSFVQTQADMDKLINELSNRSCAELPIIAKIETKMAFQNLPGLLLNSIERHPLGIMIARGDLAVELGSVRMAEIQEEILWLCEAAHVPVLWATQVLESLAKKGRTSRAEITDAAMSVRAECVILNKGPFIHGAAHVLSDILSRMEAHQQKKSSRLRALHWQ